MSRASSHVPPLEAFAQLRHVLRQAEAAVAIVVDLSDQITAQADHFSEDERRALISIRRGMEEAAVISEGRASGYRNTMVLVASNIQSVPPWIYQNNPHVALVQVGLADKDERLHFARTYLKPQDDHMGFYGGRDIPADDLDQAVDELANLAEGFSILDMEALRRTSHMAQRPVAPGMTRHLVDYFKFGEQEDPWEKLDAKRLGEAEDALGRRVIGQPIAIRSVVDMLYSSRLGATMTGANRSAKPKGVFFFVGPTGVGKTELAKSLTEFVFGDDRAFARFDMSEYREEHSAARLIGAPPGYVGYDEGGHLTRRMQEQPHSILLFDEIEKGHPSLLDKFLQILEDGRLTDGKGQTVFFNQAVIIFTSNIGAKELSQILAERGIGSMPPDAVARHFEHHVREYFIDNLGRPELLNRLGRNVVAFDFLRPQFVSGVCEKFCGLFVESARAKLHCEISVDDSIVKWVNENMQRGDKAANGGRQVKTELEVLFERAFPRWVFENFSSPSALREKRLKLAVNGAGTLQVTTALGGGSQTIGGPQP